MESSFLTFHHVAYSRKPEHSDKTEKNVLLGPAQAGLGWPYWPGPAKAWAETFSLAIHWPYHGLARFL